MGASDLRGVLEAARGAGLHTTDLGNRFERLCEAALTAHAGPNGTDRFTRVWQWSDWPQSDSRDIGIDLVAEQSIEHGGGYAAIQCKCYTGQVSTQDVDSFLAASSRPEFRSRILMHTGTGIQRHGAHKIRQAHPRCEVFDLEEMDRWDVDWWDIAEANHVVAPGTPRRKKRATGIRGKAATGGTLFRRYWRSWRRRWMPGSWWLRTWLVVESALAIAVTAAVVCSCCGNGTARSHRHSRLGLAD